MLITEALVSFSLDIGGVNTLKIGPPDHRPTRPEIKPF